MKFTSIALLALVQTSSAVKLTADNWDLETAGKTIMVKYFAEWCGHCQALKPHWDKLAGEFNGSGDKLIAEVDCEGDGGDLCDTHGIEGYPTIKYGDPNNLQEYELEREYDDMKEFANENLKPMCSPSNIDLCDDEKKAEIQKFMDMGIETLKKEVKKLEDEIEAANAAMESAQDDIEGRYQELEDDKNAKVAAIKASGLMVMKSVYASMQETDVDSIKEDL